MGMREGHKSILVRGTICIIAPFIDIPMFNKKHAGAISKLLYGFASVRAIIHSLKLVDYLHLHVYTETIQ